MRRTKKLPVTSNDKGAGYAKRDKTTSVCFFGPAPVLAGEDSQAYTELLAQVSGELKPKGLIEDFLVRDVVDAAWRVQRYRRVEIALIEAAMPQALEEMLAPLINGAHRFGALEKYNADRSRVPTPAMELVNAWMRQDAAAHEKVAEVLASANLSMADVEARAIAKQIDRIAQIGRLIAEAKQSRDSNWRELERRRELRAEDHPSDNVIEGHFAQGNLKALGKR